MKSYNFYEKWAAIPWLNQDTSQSIAPLGPSFDIQKMIDEQKAKERRDKILKALLATGLIGGGIVGGSALMDASRARQAALARKVMAKNIARGAGKGLGALGILAALGFGAKSLMDTPGDGPGEGVSLNISDALSRAAGQASRNNEPAQPSRVSRSLSLGRQRLTDAQARQRQAEIRNRVENMSLGETNNNWPSDLLFNIFYPGASALGARSSY